jgi:hypothetical protein
LSPRTLQTAPAIRISVIDRFGEPAAGVRVQERWYHYSLNLRDGVDLVTDANGTVLLPVREVRASRGSELWIALRNVLRNVDSSFGPRWHLAVFLNGDTRPSTRLEGLPPGSSAGETLQCHCVLGDSCELQPMPQPTEKSPP